MTWMLLPNVHSPKGLSTGTDKSAANDMVTQEVRVKSAIVQKLTDTGEKER